jgi:hypothetical protein
MKVCRENSSLVKMGQKISCTLREDLRSILSTATHVAQQYERQLTPLCSGISI